LFSHICSLEGSSPKVTILFKKNQRLCTNLPPISYWIELFTSSFNLGGLPRTNTIEHKFMMDASQIKFYQNKFS